MRDVPGLERKWLDSTLVEERKTPDTENIDLDQFQRSIAQMDSSLSEIDSDMQRLRLHETGTLSGDERLNLQFKEQQKKIANLVNQQQKLQTYAIQMAAAKPRSSSPAQQQTFATMRSASPPSKPLSLSQLHHQNVSQNQFFLHEQPRRTTWREQSSADQSEQTPLKTWVESNASFNLHEPRVNGGGPVPSPRSAAGSPMHARPTPPPKPVVPPRQAARPAAPPPPSDDMEPQSICFIGDAEDDVHARNHIQISSGSRTYRIPSPTRAQKNAKNPFLQNKQQQYQQQQQQQREQEEEEEEEPEKGFYISFDDEAQPKRPKPPLRGKRNSPKKVLKKSSVVYFWWRKIWETKLQFQKWDNLNPTWEGYFFPVVEKIGSVIEICPWE